jgi:hypothetical protein
VEFGIGLLVVIFILVAWSYLMRRDRRAFGACASRLGLTNARFDSEGISGELDGMNVRVRLLRGRRYEPPHMAIEVTFAPCRLLLDLRQQTRGEERMVAAGRAVDLVTDDTAFDERWIVEGAPPARVLNTLRDADLRARLCYFGLHPEARVTIEDGVVSLYRQGSDTDGSTVDDTHVRLAIELASSAAVASETPSPEDEAATATYRAAGRAGADPSGALGIIALKQTRAARRLRSARPLALLGNGVLPALSVYSMATVASAHPQALAAQAAYLAAFFGPLQVVATIATAAFLRRVQRATPGLALDTATVAAVAAGWAVLLGALAFGALH